MKTAEILRRTAARLPALVLALALAVTPALAADAPASVHIEDTVSGGYVYALSGDGSGMEPFRYDVPEGGVTALIFFGTGCQNCRSLFQTIAQGALSEDPRVNIVAVSLQGREATQSFADSYMGGTVSNVYYGQDASVPWSYARLVLGSGTSRFGTAFVLLIAKEDGKPYIVWQGQSVYDGWKVQEAVDELLGGGPAVRMIKVGEQAENGGVWVMADLRNTAGRPVSGTLYAVGYAGGRAADVQSLPLALPANGSAMKSLTVKGEAAKLFYLEEGTLRPLASAVTAGG